MKRILEGYGNRGYRAVQLEAGGGGGLTQADVSNIDFIVVQAQGGGFAFRTILLSGGHLAIITIVGVPLKAYQIGRPYFRGQLNRKCQRKYTIDKRMGCELRHSLNFTHSQKIRFIRFQE